MNAQAVTTSAMVAGPFLTLILSSRPASAEDEVSRRTADEVSDEKNGDAPTPPGAIIRSAEDAAQAQPNQPAMVNLGPMLALLMMLRSRPPRHHSVHQRELTLPPGCVLAVRYMSR